MKIKNTINYKTNASQTGSPTDPKGSAKQGGSMKHEVKLNDVMFTVRQEGLTRAFGIA